MSVLVGLTEYLGKGSADIFLLLLKLCISIVKFIKLSLLSYMLWSEFCLGGNFAHVIYYAIIDDSGSRIIPLLFILAKL